ncbi:hypothetical protein TNCV_2536151 [Trichonephila clavipes]|nr:hypothetical protein TNCV_2536151 [Trichonephila clavipes]
MVPNADYGKSELLFSSCLFVNPTPLAHADTPRDILPRGGISQTNIHMRHTGFERITSNCQSLKEVVPLNGKREVGEIGESLVIWVEAMRQLENTDQEWVDSGRVQRHDGTGEPRDTADQEDRLIVRSAVTALHSSLSTIRRPNTPIHLFEPDYIGTWLDQVGIMLTGDMQCLAMNLASNSVLNIIEDVSGNGQGSVPIRLSPLYATQSLNKVILSSVPFLLKPDPFARC